MILSACYRNMRTGRGKCTDPYKVGITHFHSFENAIYVARWRAKDKKTKQQVLIRDAHFVIRPRPSSE